MSNDIKNELGRVYARLDTLEQRVEDLEARMVHKKDETTPHADCDAY